jgi:hypothetical protein
MVRPQTYLKNNLKQKMAEGSALSGGALAYQAQGPELKNFSTTKK